MDGQIDGAALERLEEAIEREEKTIADLNRRTRTLEIEVAAWPARQKDLRLLFDAEMRRARLEALLGVVCAGAAFGIGWAALSLLPWRHH